MASFFACRLESRSVVRLGGTDRHTFLQGLISNDIKLAAGGRAIYAALLTPQGKFLHDLFVIDAGESFLIDCERAEDLIKRLSVFKLRAKVTMQDVGGQFDIWAAWGTTAARESHGEDAILYADPRLPALGARMIAGEGKSPGDFENIGFDAYDRHRLALGVADGSRDMLIEKSTLAEGNFDLLNGISWTKGCYMGQELTARMHYRGLAKKRLFPVKIVGDAPAFGSMITYGEQDCGDMRSSNGDNGLALLNIEKAEAAIHEKAALQCGESQLMVGKPEWMTTEKNKTILIR